MIAGRPGPLWLRSLLQYVLALGLSVLALWLSIVLQTRFGNPFWFFFAIAVIASTWLGGRGPGWVAVCFSTLAALYFFIPPYRSWHLSLEDVPFFLTFALCQVGSNWLVAWRKETEDAVRRARDDLEIRVEERTIELKQANDALVTQMEEQRRTQEALLAARTELARVARITTIGELTASIAHEVNQPIAAVVANADACVAWLTRSVPDLAEARAAAERAVQGATRASEVIVRIRSMIVKAAPEKGPVQLNGVIEETAALASGQAERNTVNFSLALDPALPPVFGDSIQLQQVILNLAVNGIEAMSAVNGRPRILAVRSEAPAPGQVQVSVQDTGTGVKPENLGRLFEPFFTTRPNGIGMGLSISRSIIEAHGGKLWVESDGSSGSIFRFTLPAAKEAAP
ncbi:MAG TPA: ATP-binding protein [Acidobacteriaceae bacterium]|jgi:C4-dicarboxylate-specific signal transduction histidine kinase|nr:ATP-binding protein [Acidobacteriaceae bacterium]